MTAWLGFPFLAVDVSSTNAGMARRCATRNSAGGPGIRARGIKRA